MPPKAATTTTTAKGGLKWTEIVMEEVLTIRGGFGSTYAFPVESRTMMSKPGHQEVFVHIAKNMEWLLQASTGRHERAQLKRSTLFHDLNNKLNARCAASQAAVAAGAVEVAPDAADPMNRLKPIEPAPKKRKTKLFKRCKNVACLLEMPAKEPNKYPDCTATVDVMLMPMSTNALWIRKADVPWLIEYLADECGPRGSQGVAMLDDGAEDSDATVVADAAVAVHGRPYHLEWDFDDTVTATWVDGPLKGTLPVESSIKEFTFPKWTIVDAIHTYGVTFDAANPGQLRQAVYDFVAHHCESMCRDLVSP